MGTIRWIKRQKSWHRHGHTADGHTTATYNSWNGMIQRCVNPHNPRFEHYGGRGIKVDPRWLTFTSFLEDMGERPAGRTLDRIDNDGDYCKSNCRWSTSSEQQRNTTPRATCWKGHPWTPENTYITGAGYRQCRSCRRERERA